ncbi:MAG: methyltransferase domain-containing protein [Synergistaceae bacterium]|nr:methyltransferase domain-containing protein [Synergistaceae bacterium]
MNDIIENVKAYYGKQIQSKADLASSSCCCNESPPVEIRAILPLISEEILDKFYGCGSPLPPLLEGATVLDLGCGTGRDVYIASKLVGESGCVIGVDMTTEQIETARKYQEEQRVRFGFKTSNVKFYQGYIEDLKSLGISDQSVDVVISNCVINLSPAKEQVFKEVFRVLKPGGELFFSDVYADRRIPEALAANPLLRGECLGGAMYTEDFRRIMAKCGWADFRYTIIRNIDVLSEEIENMLGFAKFSSRTVRAFKLNDLEDICEDYGQVAYYNGGIPGHPYFFDLDDHHRFFTNKPMLVCGNTASMLSNTRYQKAFKVVGDRSVHFGKFDCSPAGDNTGKVSDPCASDSCASGSCC